MAIICWGNLAKSADDTTRIEQSIHHYVQTHDEDPNAHMGEDYSLGGHRLQVELDHPPGSVHYFHVKDIHAEAITAGGIVVKGDGPYILVQDAVGNERVKIYPEGIIVKKGLIAVQNEDDEIILDKRGLWGSNISYSGQVNKPSTQTLTPANKWYDVAGLKFGAYVARSSPALLFANISWAKNIIDSFAQVRIYYPTGYLPSSDGASLGGAQGANLDCSGLFSLLQIAKFIPGDNLVKIQAKNRYDTDLFIRLASSGTTLGYMVLGN